MALSLRRPLNSVRSSHSASIYRPALSDAGSLVAGAVFPIARTPIHNRLGCAPSLPPSGPTHWIPNPDRRPGIHLVKSLAHAFFPKVG